VYFPGLTTGGRRSIFLLANLFEFCQPNFYVFSKRIRNLCVFGIYKFIKFKSLYNFHRERLFFINLFGVIRFFGYEFQCFITDDLAIEAGLVADMALALIDSNF